MSEINRLFVATTFILLKIFENAIAFLIYYLEIQT